MPHDRLLIIEDEQSVAKQLKWSLGQDFDITIATDSQHARELLASGLFPVATMDLGLPPNSDHPQEGLKLLELMPSLAPHTKVIVITGNTETEVALKAIALSAVDFCTKPIDLKVLGIILKRAFHIHALEAANRQLHEQAEQSTSLCGMIGVSEAMQTLFAIIRKISDYDFSALITGESGTGKEMVAHALHTLSSRSQGPLVIINCAAIPENLLESELFGHEKGAYTGAVTEKKGKFELADNGTVFLDEIGELPLTMQVKLLRFLQEGTIERIGGEKTLYLDVRIVAATNSDLKHSIENGTFREDLFFRLNVVPIVLPPLRERPEDIIVLAHHFLQTEAKALKLRRFSFSADALAALSTHEWPGNVRELQNRVRRALSMADSQNITAGQLGLESHDDSSTDRGEKLLTLQQAREQAELHCIQKALAMTNNNISQAAKLLAISRPTLHDLLKKHKIKP